VSVLTALDKALLIARVMALNSRARWPRQRVVGHQRHELARLRHFALQRSPFYQRFHRGLENAPLTALPVLSKAQLMDEFDHAVTDRAIRLAEVEDFCAKMSVTDLFNGRYQVCATSGTTGKRGYFLFSQDEWRWIMATIPRLMAWSGVNARERGRGAVISTTVPWHMTARGAAELRRLGMDGGRLSIDAGEPVDQMVSRLNAYKPTSILGYPSLLRLLADEQEAGRLDISPRWIVCSSEVLTDGARDAIERAFGVRPSDLYATTETGGLAASCGHDSSLHVADDLCVVEVVDEQNRPAPPGEAGAKLLVTVLFSRTIPLIRYEIADRLVVGAEPCSCKLPFTRLNEVSGRVGDILQLETRSGEMAKLAPAQIGAALRGLCITGWQLAVEDGVWRLGAVVSSDEFPAQQIKQRMQQLLGKLNVEPPEIDATRLEQLERGTSGKAKLVNFVAR
jgi:putative adenylate-forming enzyme